MIQMMAVLLPPGFPHWKRREKTGESPPEDGRKNRLNTNELEQTREEIPFHMAPVSWSFSTLPSPRWKDPASGFSPPTPFSPLRISLNGPPRSPGLAELPLPFLPSFLDDAETSPLPLSLKVNKTF